jgi:hypothetical protein
MNLRKKGARKLLRLPGFKPQSQANLLPLLAGRYDDLGKHDDWLAVVAFKTRGM